MPTIDAFGPHVTVFRELGHTAEQRAWLAALPDLVRRLETTWAIRTGSPFAGGSSSWAAPAASTTAGDGPQLVLKVAWPHREARGESVGLRLWRGNGAPILHAAEPGAYAVLMERCEPGRPLSSAGLRVSDALAAAADVLGRVWIEPGERHTLETVSDVCADWAELVRDRQRVCDPPYDPGIVALGARLLESLPSSASREVVVHGDANPTNILSSSRQPWLLIDGKPMLGDPGYDVAPLVLQLGSQSWTAESAPTVLRRFEFLADLLGESPERMLAWSVARTVESALWHASEGRIDAGSADVAEATVLARLLSG